MMSLGGDSRRFVDVGTVSMFALSIRSTFCATHQLRLADGTFEPFHGHDWVVEAPKFWQICPTEMLTRLEHPLSEEAEAASAAE